MAKDVSLLDKNLLAAAANGYSGTEMESAYGIPAAEAMMRVRTMLSARDAWDDVERRQLLLQSVFKIKESLEEATINVSDPKALDAYIKLARLLSDLLDKQGKISDAELEVITRSQAKALLGLVEAGYSRARALLAAEYPNVDLTTIDAAFRTGMSEQSAVNVE